MAHPPRTRSPLVLFSTLALVATASVAMAATQSQPPAPVARAVPAAAPDQAVTADGRITGLARVGDRIYVRGSFRTLGAYAGSGMPVDPATGARIAAPLVDGQISVSVPDGEGGWYVGGDFHKVGDVTTRGLAHLGPDGTPDPDFTHRVRGLVAALALHDDTLWLGGSFYRVDGTARDRLAAISLETGELTGFERPQERWVTELAYAEASGKRPARVYVGTDRVVALDPETGAPDPSFSSDLRGDVRALLVDGDRVLVGGQGLVALDADTGDVDTGFADPGERFPANPDGLVHTLLRSGDVLYAGGSFAALGGGTGPLVALDAATGTADTGFASAVSDLTFASGDSGVFDVTLAGGHLWVGGSFARVAGEPAGNLVALDPATGAREDLVVPEVDNGVNAVDASGDGLYVGGQFFMIDPVRAPGFAALDAETLQPIASFAPSRNGYAGMVPGDGVIYLAPTQFGGYERFDHGGGRVTYYWDYKQTIRAVDADTGASRPDLRIRGIHNLTGVTTLGRHLYVAQRRRNDQKFPRTRISVYSQQTGERVRRFRLPLRGYVAELSSVDGRLVAAGSFRRFRPDGQKAHLAVIEVDPRTGRLNEEFDLHTHGPVHEVEVHRGDLYVAGIFDRVQDGTRRVDSRGVARFSRTPSGFTGLVRRFQPPRSIRGRWVEALVGLDDRVMVQAWDSLFLDARTGSQLPDPTGGYAPQVDAAVPDPAGIVYAAHTWVALAGKDFYDLSFVARASDLD